ncbi:hypothetical protein ACRYI5_09240 [Furfurilactobacillus sp. WILCCON 0119]
MVIVDFSSHWLNDRTVDLRNSALADRLLTEQRINHSYELRLTETLLLLPVTVGKQHFTLVIDRHLGLLLTRKTPATLLRGLREHQWLTFQQMTISHQFLGQQHYVPYVQGSAGFVPTAGPTTSHAGWVGFAQLTDLQAYETAAVLVFRNELKVVMPTSLYFLRQRLVEAATMTQLQCDYLQAVVEQSGFNRRCPKLPNRLAELLTVHPRHELSAPRDFYGHAIEALMTAAVEDFLMTGYGDTLKLDRVELAADVRGYLHERGRYLVPKKRHFASMTDHVG